MELKSHPMEAHGHRYAHGLVVGRRGCEWAFVADSRGRPRAGVAHNPSKAPNHRQGTNPYVLKLRLVREAPLGCALQEVSEEVEPTPLSQQKNIWRRHL